MYGCSDFECVSHQLIILTVDECDADNVSVVHLLKVQVMWIMHKKK